MPKTIIFLSAFLLIFTILSGQIELTATLYNVSVVGAVRKPGVFHLLPTNRVSEAISLANRSINVGPKNTYFKLDEKGALTEATEEVEEDFIEPEDVMLPEPSFRNIILKRQGQEIKLDLLKFFLLGQESENPYIQDGDLIVVPAVQKEVSIYGSVNRPGNYELTEGERISDIIELALGLSEGAYVDVCLINRYLDDGSNFIEIPINLDSVLTDPDSQDNLLLQHGDRINIRSIPDYHHDKIISIMGEVLYPGEYLVDGISIWLSDILEKASIKFDTGDLSKAVFVRKTLKDEIDPEFNRLKLITPAEMTYLEYEFFKAKIRDYRGRFSIDLQYVLENPHSAEDIILQNEDFIFIPLKELSVKVSGQVNEPGFYTFKPGMTYKDYLDEAGGFSDRAKASKIRLIKADTDVWVKLNNSTVIEPGDEIFVPEKPVLNYWTIAKETIVMLSQIATLILVVQNASGS